MFLLGQHAQLSVLESMMCSAKLPSIRATEFSHMELFLDKL